MTQIHRILKNRVWLVVLAALLLLLVVAPASKVEARGHGVYHHVRYGEYLSEIAFRYGVPIHAILQVNPQITNPDLIFAGSKILIPARQGACRFHHYVSRGQTLSQISRHYGVPVHVLVHANHLHSPDLIYAGSRLCVP